ncbi:hypothetical protein ACQKKX_18445 [Neorhizobium sp. NPDC001467]|uniref:hypothetical protein n=1 Tax=Neorhizobium sp. NPDC001467 TaxID=3390595 RepID=UPI003D0850E9
MLASCTTSGSGTRVSSASYIAALQGGVISRSGIEFDKSDRQRALEAEYRALEGSPGGQPVTWAGSGIRGQVVANAPFQVGAQNCRQYTHTITPDGRAEVKARGTACRNADGTWTPLI